MTKEKTTSAGRKIYTVACVVLMAAMASAVAFKVLAGGTREPLIQDFDQGATVLCPDDRLGGEVTLLYDPSRPWELRYTLPEMSPPSGGEYKQPEIKTHWEASAGTIQAEGNTKAFWTPGNTSGLHTVHVTIEVLYLPKEESGLNSPRPVCRRYHASRRFLQPKRQVVQPGAKTFIGAPEGYDKFLVGRYPDPRNPKDLENSSTPQRITSHPETFSPPQYWYRVDDETKNLRISRSYTLGEFDLNRAYRPDWPWPGYIALDVNIVQKLEELADLMREAGEKITKFDIIYGYRSPAYNLGARAEDDDKTLKSSWSLHMYGMAADIIVDEDDDGIIDDLDRDGKIGRDDGYDDAKVIRKYVRQLDKKYLSMKSPLLGANFVYRHHDFWEREPQTPYIHIDVRGFARENGTLIEYDVPSTID